MFYRDVGRTCASIEKFSRKDAEAYRQFYDWSVALMDILLAGAFSPPTPFGTLMSLLEQSEQGQELARSIMMSALDIVNEWFEGDEIRIAITRWATELRSAPQETGTGAPTLMIAPFIHKYGGTLPEGGSGAVSWAMERCIKDLGGTIRTSSTIKSIKVEDGRASGVVLDTGEEILARVPAEQKEWFKTLLALAPKAGTYSEDHNFYLDHHITGLMRRAYLEWGKRYTAAGAIEERDDIFFLVSDEILRTAFAPERYNFRSLTGRRKEKWEADCKREHPPIIGRLGMEQAFGVLIQAADPVVNKILIESMPVPKPELKADLYGICGSPGAAEGTARVIFSPDQFSEVQPGDILVAPTTYSSWTPLFAIIKGAIVDRGGTLVHAAIVGREYGIPVVINCFEGTTKIKSGQRVKVDGDLGVVYILGD